jgi:glucosamine--fructose-6-phosphate aminotransferase (isomerizing)
LKHGPIALVDSDLPVIVLAPRDRVFEKTLSNVQEVAARNGRIILIADGQAAHDHGLAVPVQMIAMPEMGPEFSAIVYAVPVQMIAYHTAVFMGKDADQPRNLAKSVTVE